MTDIQSSPATNGAGTPIDSSFKVHIGSDGQLVRKKLSWVFSYEQIASDSPSRLDQISFENELIQRAKGVNFIFSAGQTMDLEDAAVLTHSAVLFHRFYLRFSIKRFHYYDIGGTSLFLGSKIEERMRPLRNVAVACTKVASKNLKMVVNEQSKDYWRWYDTILYDEELLLESLSFDVTFQFYDGLLELEQNYKPDAVLSRKIHTALTDWMRTPIALLYTWPDVVLAAFYYTVSKTDQSSSGRLHDMEGWNHFMKKPGRKELCNDILHTMSKLYKVISKMLGHEYDFTGYE